MSDRSPLCDPMPTPLASGLVNSTSACGSRTGSVASSTLFSRLKMAVLAPMPRASERDGDERETRAGAKDADGVTEILHQHVAVLLEGGGDEVAQRARPDRGAGPDRNPVPGAACVAELGVEGAEHLAAVLAAERRRIAPEQHAVQSGARIGSAACGESGRRRAPGSRSSVTRRASASATARPRAVMRVVAAPLVGAGRIGALAQLLDQALLQHPPHGAVERAGAEAHLAVGALADVLHDRVAVPLLVGEGDQDVEDRGGQRQEGIDVV